jgi:hypothetical protein
MTWKHRAQGASCAMQQTLSAAVQGERIQLLQAAWKLLRVPEGRRRPRAWSTGCHIAVVAGHGWRESAAQLMHWAQILHLLCSMVFERRYSGGLLVLMWQPAAQGSIATVRAHLHGVSGSKCCECSRWACYLPTESSLHLQDPLAKLTAARECWL